MYFCHFRFSPTSSLNNKKIASRDDLGSDIIVGVENTPLSSLPGTTISRTTGMIPSTASVNTLPGLVGGIRDDSSITSGSSGFGSLPKKKNEGMNHSKMFGKMFQFETFKYVFILKTQRLKIPNHYFKIDGLSSMVSSNVTDSGMSESSEPLNTMMSDSITSTNNHLSQQQLTGTGNQAQQSALSTANSGMEQGHSRNSSNTSQVSVISSGLIIIVSLLRKV